MKPEKVFKRYDIRGIFEEEIDQEFAFLLGKSIGSFALRDNYQDKVVVSKDNKESSEILKNRLIEGLRQTGVDAVDLGTGPTDYLAFGAVSEDSIGVQVTSSHMPLRYNGFKLVYPEGNSFVNQDLDRVETYFIERDFELADQNGLVLEKTYRKSYIESLKDYVGNFNLDYKGKKIAVDTCGGTASFIIEEILEDLGAKVVDFADYYDLKGIYRDPPHPGSREFSDFERFVGEIDADLGLVFDLDSDRVKVFKDEWLDGNDVFAVLADLTNTREVVGSFDTSKRVGKMVDKLHMTRVGDPFVLDEAVQKKVELAGEPNGHYAFPDFVPYSSGILSGLLISGVDLNRKLEKIEDFNEYRRNLEVEDKHKVVEKLEKILGQNYNLKTLDGVKIVEDDLQVLARASGSENAIRVVGDGKNDDRIKKVVGKVCQKISEIQKT